VGDGHGDIRQRESDAMKNTEFLKTTVKGGLIFLIPIGFILLALGKAFELVSKVSRPVVDRLPIEGPAGLLIVDLLSVLILILLCFIAGLMANLAWVRSKITVLENMLLSNVPIYSFVDSMVRSFAAAEDNTANLMPVVAHFDDNAQLGFEVERTEAGNVVVYLPGAPNPWSGNTIYMTPDRVERIDIKTHEAIKVIRVLGRGSGKYAGKRAGCARPVDAPR
jgi:uncharacterized membrane protein